jgi:hypothetical protein
VQSYAAISGYIAALYVNELYDVQVHQATYRTFGITEREVRSNVWLIVEPPRYDADGRRGVYPRTDRNSLLLRGGPNAGGGLPWGEWGNEFADLMPRPLLDAIKAARAGKSGSLGDDSWRQRLAERFGNRWRIDRLKRAVEGILSVTADQRGTEPRTRPAPVRHRGADASSGGTGGPAGPAAVGASPGAEPARRPRVAGALPYFRAVRAEDLEDGMLAAWQPNDPEYAEGAVLINVEHPVMVEVIQHWQEQFGDVHAEEVRDEVIKAYGEVAVAKVAHSEHLRSELPRPVIEEKLRSTEALTMSLLGLIGEEAIIAPRLGGKFRRRAA